MAVKAGIVGAGGMAAYHYDGFTRAGAVVAAIADMNTGRAESFAKTRPVGNIFEDLSGMLRALPDLDAVSVVTPNKFHKPLVIEALEAGRHVFCEKPPALNAGEMEQMLAASKKAGRILMFDFNNRARPESMAMMRYIREGAAGKINSAQANWVRRAGIPGFGGWFTTKALSGGGPVIDLPHMLDLALHFMGYPDPAWCLGGVFYDFMDNRAFKGPWGIPDSDAGITDVESSCHAMVTFKTGQTLMVRCSWAEFVERETVAVSFQGTKAGGKVERLFGIDGIDATSIDSCRLFTEEYGNQVNRDIVTEKDETMGRVGQAANFIETITGSAPALNTPEEALILMKIVDAMYQSAASGKPVQIG
ncbi:MAG: Gfo/Idh/MocA family oxidoreductase [Spirochaetaceae bacterium]|jgi:predicted dehydrogenase|nr:Gfo/Idh/MocA family oxidoreductase [Spirochaetaceae bacterium]